MAAQGDDGGSATVKIKSDPARRLSSFKPTRDLMLQNITTKPLPKKSFVPNLNATRNKNKGPQIADTGRDRRKNDKHNGRAKPNIPNRQSNILKSGGVFSEGIAGSNVRRYGTRDSYSSKDSTETISKPVFNRQRIDKKINKDFAELKLHNPLSDDDAEDAAMDSHNLPIRLPMRDERGLFSTQLDYDIRKAKPLIKTEIVKTEPLDDGSNNLTENLDSDVKSDIKIETSSQSDMNFLNDCDMRMFMLQFPDNLPGRGPEERSDKKSDENQTETETDAGCKFAHLEEGQIGKIVLHKSGKIKLFIGNTHYDLNVGSKCCFRQDVVSIAVDEQEKTGRMINLGNVTTKITAIPDWERLFDDCDRP